MNKYYCYKHVDPTTQEVVYVGHGSGGRAWQCGSSHSPLRSKEHCKWADEMLERGVTPDEWTVVIYKGLTKDKAKETELALIHLLKPKFNQSIRYPHLKFTPELYDKAVELRNAGYTYQTIAKILGLSAMVVHRGLNKKSITLETALADRK